MFRVFLAILTLSAAGCSAQPAPSMKPKPEVARRIETQLRQKFTGIPPTVVFTYGERKPSAFPGYDTLPVTLTNGERSSTLEFLISRDDSHLARLEKIDISAWPAAWVPTEGRPIRGNPQARVTILNFDDFQCPYCAMMHHTLTEQVLKHYGDKVRIIYKDYPLVSIHPWATHAAVNANCVAEQNHDGYWEYADFLHFNMREINSNEKGEKRTLVEQQKRLNEEALAVGRRRNLDAARLQACIQKQDDSAVKASMAEGEKLEIDGTPTMFINGERISGAMPFDHLRVLLDRALRSEGQEPPVLPDAAGEKDAGTKPPATAEPKPGVSQR